MSERSGGQRRADSVCGSSATVCSVDLAVTILNTLATLVAAVAAVGAWRAARQSSRATNAMTATDRNRRHAELRPRFRVSCRATSEHRAQLRVELEGPSGLNRLDQVSVTIRDDIRGRAPAIAGGPTADDIARQVWGPYRFVPGVDGAGENGRTVAPVELLLGDWQPFALERTPPPYWYSSADQWRQQYTGAPVRLTLHCSREGDEPWRIPDEVRVDSPAQT